MTYLYRYRGAVRAIDELESRTIFFSKIEDLNDPMEGFKDLFWSGDQIVWRALLKHYVLCLLETTYHVFTAGVDFDSKIIEKIVFNAPGHLPEAPIRGIYNELVTEILADPAVVAVLAAVVSRPQPIRRNELVAYFRALHRLIVAPLFADMHRRGLWPGFVPPPPKEQEAARKNTIKLVHESDKFFKKENIDSKASDIFFAASEATTEQIQLLGLARLPDRNMKRPLFFILGDFPRAYITALDKLVHPDLYVACFTRRPDNHSMWSTYGDGHKGVCFIFKSSEDGDGDPTLHLNRTIGASAAAGRPTVPVCNFVPHPVRPVQYSSDYPAIDFFRSLGRIRQVDMNDFWYLGEAGQFSSCRDAIYTDEETWRRAYWETFAQSALYKTPEWAHEEEYRVLAYSAFDMSAPEARKFQFRFCDLAGIVFGARTPTEIKLKIMDIVSSKCAGEGRSDFKFSEVRYSPGMFKVQELGLLKFRTGP